MKKTFLARRNAILTPSGVPLGGLLLAVVLLLFLFRSLFPSAFDRVLAPVFSLGNGIHASVHNFLTGFRDAQVLAKANQDLVDRYTDLALQNRTLVEKVSDLSALLGNIPAPHEGVVVGVFARPPESPYDTLLVGGGLTDGVTVGMEAFGAGGVPIGVVTQTTNSFARVTLFSSPGTRISAWIGKNRIPVTLTGAGGGAFTGELPTSSGAAVGDTILIPGPGALPIGTLTALETDASSAIAKLRITPFINLFSITQVSLVDQGFQFQNMLASSTKP